MEKNLAVKSNRSTLQWIEGDENDDEPKGLTDLSNIQNQSNGFKSADTEAFKEIEKNVEFKKAFNGFIDEILKTQNAGNASREYVKKMENEIRKKEKDPKYEINDSEINKARQKFLSHPDVVALRKDGNFDKETFELDVEKKFPKQMHELKRLMSIGDGEKRAKSLMSLGKRFDVDDEKLKRLINEEYLIEIPETGEISEEMDEETAKRMRGEKNFQASKATGDPVNFKTSVESGLRTLSETLSQIVLSGEGSDPNQIKELENDYNQVKAFLKQWEGSDEQTVRNWARRKKGQLQPSEALETVAVMDQGNYLLTKGHRLRDPQILAILIFLKSKENQGKLCQISPAIRHQMK